MTTVQADLQVASLTGTHSCAQFKVQGRSPEAESEHRGTASSV